MPAQGPLRDRGAPGFHLIETMRLEPGAGLVRGALHLARLERSARALGFAFDRDAAEARLQTLEEGTSPRRIRLTLEPDGTLAITAHSFAPVAQDAVWTLRIAAARLASADPLLRHKTSARAIYEAARAQFSPQEADEVLLLNEQGHVCEGTITSVFARLEENGPLATPPLACGLLDGVLRRELIARGEACERPLLATDLAGAGALYVGNSLRGLIRARLVLGGGLPKSRQRGRSSA